jgi:hypothetical protein
LKRNRKVKELIPKEKLASFRLEDGFGWEEMCPFLGKPIPSVPYPRANTPERFEELQAGFINKAVRKVAAVAVTSILVPTIAVAAWYYWYYYQKRR